MATMEKPKPKERKKKSKHKSLEILMNEEIEDAIREPFLPDDIESNSETQKEIAEEENCSNMDSLSNMIPEISINKDEQASIEVEPAKIEATSEIKEEQSCSVEELKEVAQSCREISESLSKIVQPLPEIEDSHVAEDNTIISNKINETTKQFTTKYRELSLTVEKMKQSNLCQQKKSYVQSQVIPFSYEEIQSLFGVKELSMARQYASEFEQNEMQSPHSSHPLFEALTEYQRARSQQISNQREVSSLKSECGDKQNTLWYVKNYVQKSGGRCANGCYLDSSYSYQVAELQKPFFSDFQRNLSILREKVTETHSLHSHAEFHHKIQIDEIIWMSVVNGCESIKDSLRIIFWVLRTSGWGYDRELRKQLRKWCCSLASILIEKDDSLQNILFLLHHILRISQGIKWSFHLIQCPVKCANDIAKALSLLEAILLPNKSIHPTDIRQRVSESRENGDFDLASEATDESIWFVVDSDGEGADLEAVGAQNSGLLSENDLLGLLKQIPFQNIFTELMVIRNDGNELIFCGGNLNGGPILRIFAGNRILLSIIRSGLITYKKYQELSKELCRIALHSVKYCTDLWEVASSNCEANLIERLSAEYNCVFLSGWSTIECTGSRDISTLFLSEMPFNLVTIQTLETVYKNIVDQLIVSDSVWCYYSFVSISCMASTRPEEYFASNAIRHLYEIGFSSDFSDLGCGEWSRTLCGIALRSKPHLIGALLGEGPLPVEAAWLRALPLAFWRPPTGELLCLLHSWKSTAKHLIPHLIKGMDWSRESGLELQTHQAVGLFLVSMSQSAVSPKSQYPEWIWECIILLKLHCYDWNMDKASVLGPETLSELDTSGKCHASSIMTILMTSWGHSVPQIFLHTAPLLLKLATAGRFAEVVHALYYIIPVLAECPDSIGQCKVFKELLSLIICTEKSYAKMASRLVIGDIAGPVVKSLETMIQAQLSHFGKFSFRSPAPILMVWLHWITSWDSWQTDWVAVHVLDVALGECFLHHDAISIAAAHFGTLIQSPNGAKSPTASSAFGSWLWSGGGNSSKGLVQCSVEAPYLWHATLWTEHSVMERDTGLWQRLVEKLHNQKEGTKVNIDKTLKSVGCSENSGILVIYRSLQYATSMSLSHPLYTLIWQLFFYLYLDVSFLNVPNKKLVGPLFFEGLVNSRLLGKAKARLLEAREYHDTKVKKLAANGSPNEYHSKHNERQRYHDYQRNLMQAFYTWLEDPDSYMTHNGRFLKSFYDKFAALMTGQNSIWMETVDHFQLNSIQAPVWPNCIIQNGTGPPNIHPPPLQNNRGKSPDAAPSDRILARLNTYEKPAVESADYKTGEKLEPLVDPTITRDFNKVHQLMNHHLKELEKCSQKYDNSCRSLSSIDGNLCDLIQCLFEKKHYFKRVNLSCGEKCTGSVNLVLQGYEWKKNEGTQIEIDCNRKIHQSALEEAMIPYKNVAIHTSVISKLAQLAHDGKIVDINNRGVVLFNAILNSITEENNKFPPVSQVLVNVATLLGEKFVTNSGEHCIRLVSKVRGSENVSLIGTLLRPSQLSTVEMLRVYSAISTSVQDSHVAFSYLSKFHISGWLYDTRPSVLDRSKFISILCEGLGMAGCEPSQDRLILHELMCIHLSKLLAWEFPVHLGQVLSLLCTLSLDKKLPPETWQHCITIIETYPHLLSHQQACDSMDLIGRQWWSKRGTWGPHGLYGRYQPYCSQMGRLGAVLSSTVLSTAMLHSPPLLTRQICSVVMNAFHSYWDVWLCPWWGGGAQAPAWVGDLSRGPALMPWGPDDAAGPDTMLDALVETIVYCAKTLPGSLNDLLSLTWQWYSCHFVHQAVGSHILLRIHQGLTKLPWTVNTQHWLTLQDLQIISKVTAMNLPTSNTFTQQCLGDKLWSPWLNNLPEQLQPSAVQLLLPLLLKLNPSQQILDDALNLPWNLLSLEIFEEIVNWFMATQNTEATPFHTNRLFPLVCGVGGLSLDSQFNEEYRKRRMSLIRSWINCLADMNSPTSVTKGTSQLLIRIEETAMSLGNTSESQKCAEASHLLSVAVLMLNMMVLPQVALQEWISWVKRKNKICITSLLSCLLRVTKQDIFANLSEETLTVYFEVEGEWNVILNNWMKECVISVEYLIGNNSLLTAMATYKSTDRTKHHGTSFYQVDKSILQTLHGIEIESRFEKQASLWVCYMISLIGDHTMDRANTFAVINQVVAILERWAQDPAWGLFTAIGLVQNKAPTQMFRIITRYALCLTLEYQQRVKESSSSFIAYTDSNTYGKALSSLESLVSQKACADVKYILLKCLDTLKNENSSTNDSVRSIVDVCSELYKDVNYFNNVYSLFKL